MILNWYKIGTLVFFHHYSNIQYLDLCECQFTTAGSTDRRNTLCSMSGLICHKDDFEIPE